MPSPRRGKKGTSPALRPLSLRLLHIRFGLCLELCGELTHPLLHDLARLKLHRRSSRNDEMTARLVRVATDARLGEFHLKHAEIAQLDVVPICKRLNNLIESPLDDLKYLVLNQPSFVADAHNNFSLGECGHIF